MNNVRLFFYLKKGGEETKRKEWMKDAVSLSPPQ